MNGSEYFFTLYCEWTHVTLGLVWSALNYPANFDVITGYGPQLKKNTQAITSGEMCSQG